MKIILFMCLTFFFHQSSSQSMGRTSPNGNQDQLAKSINELTRLQERLARLEGQLSQRSRANLNGRGSTMMPAYRGSNGNFPRPNMRPPSRPSMGRGGFRPPRSFFRLPRYRSPSRNPTRGRMASNRGYGRPMTSPYNALMGRYGYGQMGPAMGSPMGRIRGYPRKA